MKQALLLCSIFASLSSALAQAPLPAEPQVAAANRAAVTHGQPSDSLTAGAPQVAAANRAAVTQLPFSDRQDFEDANRGFIATDTRNPDRDKFLEQGAAHGEPEPLAPGTAQRDQRAI